MRKNPGQTTPLQDRYQLREKLSATENGAVCLAENRQTKKLAVIKMSKRPAALPENVSDTLKDLTHSGLARVSDFVVSPNKTYLIMEFIDGESLDKPLRKGRRFPEKQVVAWGITLLEILQHLHSRKWIHGNIQPSHLMETPDGDIRLVGLNVALSTGDSDAFRARRGDSRYTPPDFSLNAQSDLYSLSATLCHLLLGKLPAGAADVRRVSTNETLLAVLEKGMAANPAERYQSAGEMLNAWRKIKVKEPRGVPSWAKEINPLVAVVAGAALLAVIMVFVLAPSGTSGGDTTESGGGETTGGHQSGGGETTGGNQSGGGEATGGNQSSKIALAEAAWSNGDALEAVRYATEAMNENESYPPEACRVLASVLGVYDLSSGYKPYRSIELKSKPVKAAFSPDGTKAAVLLSKKEIMVYSTENGQPLAGPLAANYSALSDLVFSDGDTLIYAGEEGLTAYSVSARSTLWTKTETTSIALSGDSQVVAGIFRDSNLCSLYEAASGNPIRTVSFDEKHQSALYENAISDPMNELFILNDDGEWLAVSFSDGGLTVFDCYDYENRIQILPESTYTHFEGGFYGSRFVYAAYDNNGYASVEIVDLDTRQSVRRHNWVGENVHLLVDNGQIIISYGNKIYTVDPWDGELSQIAETDAKVTFLTGMSKRLLALTQDGKYVTIDRQDGWRSEKEENVTYALLGDDYALLLNPNRALLPILKWEDRTDNVLLWYDPDYAHVEARMYKDDSSAVLFNSRNFRIFRANGDSTSMTAIPDPADLRDQQYLRDVPEECLALYYEDGRILSYSAKTGERISETYGERPGYTFTTADFIVTYEPHGAIQIQDANHNTITEITEEAELAYAVQTGDNLILHFTTLGAKPYRYGLLLDKNGKVLAELPRLCDVLPDGRLIFDDMHGHLSQRHIFTAEELLQVAQSR